MSLDFPDVFPETPPPQPLMRPREYNRCCRIRVARRFLSLSDGGARRVVGKFTGRRAEESRAIWFFFLRGRFFLFRERPEV